MAAFTVADLARTVESARLHAKLGLSDRLDVLHSRTVQRQHPTGAYHANALAVNLAMMDDAAQAEYRAIYGRDWQPVPPIVEFTDAAPTTIARGTGSFEIEAPTVIDDIITNVEARDALRAMSSR